MINLMSCRSVDNYKKLNEIEEGTYGLVFRAQCKQTGDIVALKKLKLSHEREGFPVTSLREIATLLGSHHENIVNVREVVVGQELSNVFIVMDYMEHDLRTLMDSDLDQSIFTLGESKEIIRQVLSAVEHLHKHWIVHRDLKTSNLLLSNRGKVQVADFGLARRLGPRAEQLTPVVVTLWYRAPELLLGDKSYTSAIDMWSVGCILAELLLGRPLLPGKTEIDQIDWIFRVFGYPDELTWPECKKLSGLSSISAAKYISIPPAIYNLNAIFTKRHIPLSDAGYDLLLRCFEYDPKKRITAREALGHEWFREQPVPKGAEQFPSWPSVKGAKEAKPAKMGRRGTPEAPHLKH